jgi:hypothetical protein
LAAFLVFRQIRQDINPAGSEQFQNGEDAEIANSESQGRRSRTTDPKGKPLTPGTSSGVASMGQELRRWQQVLMEVLPSTGRLALARGGWRDPQLAGRVCVALLSPLLLLREW